MDLIGSVLIFYILNRLIALTGGEIVSSDSVNVDPTRRLMAKFIESSVLASTDRAIDDYEELMLIVRKSLKDIIGDRKILVVDGGIGLPTRNMKVRFSLIEKLGLHEVVKRIVERLFGGKIPETVTEFIGHYFGNEINLIHYDVRSKFTLNLQDYAAVIIGGSPASVSLKDDYLDFANIYEVVSDIHSQLRELGIPVIGICYGSHVLTQEHGGKVESMDMEREGMDPVSLKEERDFWVDIFGMDLVDQGESYVAHGDASTEFGSCSLPLGKVVDDDKEVNQFAVHLNNKVFSGDMRKDISLLRREMAVGEYAGFGIQGHYELAFSHLLFSYIYTGRPVSDYPGIKNRMLLNRQVLQFIGEFLSWHKNFSG